MVAEHRFQILDVGLALAGPDPFVAPIAHAYRRFSVPALAGERLQITLAPDHSSIAVDGQCVPLVPGLDPTPQLYQRALVEVMDRLGSHAMLHAAALEVGGTALLLAAPSGHGKTCLTLELARRGLRFLSDDYAPLDLASGLVAPYPRAVGVIPDATTPIPAPFRDAVFDPCAVRLLGKSLVDVGEVLGDAALGQRSAPLARVVLLTGPEPAARETVVHMASRPEHRPAIDARVATIPGVEIAATWDEPSLHHWRLSLQHDLFPTGALGAVLESEEVVFSETVWTSRPDFSTPPRLEAVSRRVAAEHLGRELLNRRRRGRLLARYGGHLAGLFADLAAALGPADCFRVHAGGCQATADLIQSRIRLE